MKIRIFYILIGLLMALNISAQNISKPVIKKRSMDTPKCSTTIKKKITVRIARDKPYHSKNNSYKQISANELLESARNYYKNKDYKNAFDIYNKPLVQQIMLGDDYCHLADMYSLGEGCTTDKNQAFRYYSQAMQLGSAFGEFCIGRFYEWGDGGVQKDFKKAISFYKNAAEKGDWNAIVSLIYIYKNGSNEISKNFEELAKWLKKAIDAIGLPRHMFELGNMYETGLGVSKNYEQAVLLYKKAAQEGNKDAQKRLQELKETW